MLARFLKQPNRTYRNMQIALSLLTLNFAIPSFIYLLAPENALEQFRQLGALFGAEQLPASEESHIWRVLAFSNVLTLALLCVLVQLNVRRFALAILVFAVLKGGSALGFLYTHLAVEAHPVFLAAFGWDGLAVFLVVFFGTRSLRSLRRDPAAVAQLVPRLRFEAETAP